MPRDPRRRVRRRLDSRVDAHAPGTTGGISDWAFVVSHQPRHTLRARQDPHKTYADFLFWIGDGEPRRSPACIIRLTSTTVLTGAGQIGLTGAALDRYRAAVASPEGAQLRAIVDQSSPPGRTSATPTGCAFHRRTHPATRTPTSCAERIPPHPHQPTPHRTRRRALRDMDSQRTRQIRAAAHLVLRCDVAETQPSSTDRSTDWRVEAGSTQP